MISVALEVNGSYYKPVLHFARHETHSPGPVNTWHQHAMYHVVYVTEGSGIFRLNDQTIDAVKDMLFFISPNQWHQFFAGEGSPFRYMVVSFELVDESGDRSVYPIADIFASPTRRWIKPFINEGPMLIPQTLAPDLSAIFHEAFVPQNVLSRSIQDRTLVLSFLSSLGIFLHRMATKGKTVPAASTQSGYRRDLVDRALHFMNEHHARPLLLEEIAGHVHLHPVYFAQLFKEEVGLPPRQCLLKIRLNHAKRLLVESDRPIGHIADECGFRTVAYFSRAFREAEGLSPSIYRRQVMGG